MKNIKLIFSILAITLPLIGGAAQAVEVNRNISEYNLEDGVGLKGYDPVSVFPVGGGQALVGRAEIQMEYMGVTYMFASQENFSAFAKNPEKFEPSYGGFCAYAMASGSKVDIQPGLFTIHGNRAHYFVSARAKKNFDADVAGFETRADGFWKKISGEDPRL